MLKDWRKVRRKEGRKEGEKMKIWVPREELEVNDHYPRVSKEERWPLANVSPKEDRSAAQEREILAGSAAPGAGVTPQLGETTVLGWQA